MPAGWTVLYNEFAEPQTPDALKEDLLQLFHERENRLIDLGWYASENTRGAYLIVVHEGDFEGPRLAEFRSADHAKIVAELERLMASL